MRIGVLTTSYPRAADDAAGNFVAGLNRHLVRRGHEVEVLAAGNADEPETGGGGPALGSAASWSEDPRIQVLRVPSRLFYRGGAPDALAGLPRWSHGTAAASDPVRRAYRRLIAYGEAARFSFRLGQLLARRVDQYDALISHWVVPCGVLGVLVSLRQHLPWAPRRRALPHLMIAHSSDIHLLRALRCEALVPWLRRRADLVYTAPFLVVRGAPGRVVPMGVDVDAFTPRDEQEQQEARHRLGLVRPTVLFLGRLVPVKGVEHLLRAALLANNAYDVWIAGSGPDEERLRSLAQPLGCRVRFWGEVRGALRRDLLIACDVLAVPSVRLPDRRTEGAPTVILEALSAGCPIVASDVGGIAHVLGDAGLLLPAGAARELDAALRLALTPGWRRACSKRAQQRAQRYDWSKVGPLILGDLLP